MAKANLSGIASACKSSRIPFDSLVAPGTPVSAKTNPPALPADLTAAIAALVKESTQVALRDLLGLTAGSGRPDLDVAAVDAAVPDATAEAQPAAAAPAAPPEATVVPPATPTSAPPAPTAPSLRTISVDGLEPVIVIADRDERADLGQHTQLQSPGFYSGLWLASRTCYPGFGDNVGGRAGSNPELGGASPADRTVCIADRHGRLTAQQALVGERLLGQLLQQPGGFTLRNKLPAGAPVALADYDMVRVFVARACLALREAGVLFTTVPAAALLLAPVKATPFRPLEPDAPVYRLAVAGLRSHLADEGGEWRLLGGSEVRAEVLASAFGPASMARAELLHCGGLLRTGHVLSTTRDLYFSSSWAAAHFVLGQKPRSDVWKSIPRAGDAPRPRR